MAIRGNLGIYFYLHLLLMINMLYCADVFDCTWKSGSGKLITVIGSGVIKSEVATSDECKHHCLAQSEYLCHAFDYNSNEQKCELHVENLQTGYIDEAHKTWTYAIRPICAGVCLPWTAVNNTAATENSGTSFDDYYYTEGVNRVEDCVSSCMTENNPTYQCRSVTLSRDSDRTDELCEPRNVRSGDEGFTLETNNGYQTFNRPSWYLDDSPYSTSVALQAWDATGTAAHIFHESHRVPVSGYLVGWRYYHQGSSRCTSYAAIWRSAGQDGFKLISKTLLNDTNVEDGTKFQYVTDVIRVQKNDVVGIHVKLNQNGIGGLPEGCGGNRVSVNKNNGQKQIVVSAGDVTNRTLPVGMTLTVSDSNLQNRTASINVFLAPYLIVPEAPNVTHIVKKSDITISWRKPETTENYELYPIRHRLHCSTDPNFTSGHEVSCLNSTLTEDTTDTTLSRLVSIKPVYSRIQTVRNIYGREEPDEAYSPTSLPFCTAHSRNLSLSFNIGTIELDNIFAVNITLNGQHPEDECLSQYRVLGYEAGSSQLLIMKDYQDKTMQQILTLQQGLTYIFVVDVKLADDFELTAASQQFTIPTGAPNSPAKPKDAVVGSVVGPVVGSVVVAVAVAFLIAVLVAWRRGALHYLPCFHNGHETIDDSRETTDGSRETTDDSRDTNDDSRDATDDNRDATDDNRDATDDRPEQKPN